MKRRAFLQILGLSTATPAAIASLPDEVKKKPLRPARKYLEKIEWKMGNGQCPKCCGLNPDWYIKPFKQKVNAFSTKVGHKKSCKLALALIDVGSNPVYKS